MYENNYLEIDLDRLETNAKNIVSKYHKYKYKIAMIKGNAYGHGYYIVNNLINCGFNYLAVSSLDEAICIRKYNKIISILIVEPIDLKYINIIIENNITISVHSINYLKELTSVTNYKVKIHFVIDSGLNRLGFNNKKDFTKAYDLLNDRIDLEGIFSHFGTTGVIDNRWDNQVNKFKEIISDIDLNKVKIIHLFSSFSLLSHPKLDICNGFRIGSSLFGLSTFPKYGNGFKDKLRLTRNDFYKKKYNLSDVIYNNDIELKTCLSLHSKIIDIKDIKKNEYVGYGLEYKTNSDIKIAIADIGYEDGIGRKNNNRSVIINNNKYDIIGEIGMCMIIIKVDDKVSIDDDVIIMGNGIPISSIANSKSETVHEVFLSLGKILPKRYIKNNKKVYETYITEEEK